MSGAGTIWPAAKELLKARLSDWQYDTWIGMMTVVQEDERALVFEVDTAYSVNYLTDHYLAEIRSAVTEAAGGERTITLTVSKNPSPSPEQINRAAAVPKAPAKGARGHKALERDYTFANFMVGKSNAFAHAAALHVSENPGKGYNPLFLYSTPGLGKTHLMQAIGHAIHDKDPGRSIVYVGSEPFVNDLVTSIRHKKMDEFRKRYRKADVLLVDDVQFFGNKDGTMEEAFHTINVLLDAKKQIVLTSDRPPKDLRDLDKRLVSRFEMGLVADIQPPELETRLAILRQYADSQGMALPDDIAVFIASNFSSDIREMKGAATRVLAISSLGGIPLSLDLAKEHLRGMINDHNRNLTPDEIVRQAARELGVKVPDLRSKRRSQDIAEPRQIIMLVLRRCTDLSLPAIGEMFGGRDHTTVLHAIRKIDDKMTAEADFKARVDALLRNFHRG